MKKSGIVIFFILFCSIFLVLIIPRILQIRALQKRSEVLEGDLRSLRGKNQVLENELRLLRDDPVYIEKVARQRFNKAKQGEIVYKVVRSGERVDETANRNRNEA